MGFLALLLAGIWWSPVLILATVVLAVLIVVGLCAGPARQASHN